MVTKNFQYKEGFEERLRKFLIFVILMKILKVIIFTI